jgi:hypothetical protein
MENQNTLSQQDYINASLLFSQALSLIFENQQGIIVDVKNEDIKLGDTPEKVVIYKLDDRIHVQKIDEDLQEGTVVNLNHKEEEEEK